VPKAMQDGERREIKIPDDKIWKGRQALPTVIAIQIDCDTPYVEVQFKGQTLMLTDTDARGLYQKLIKAIDILPTSK
jgi:hypothetical protein